MSKGKSILLVLSLIFLIILSASLVSWSVPAYPGQITDYYANAPTSEYDYIVGRYNTSFYYAKNGSTGNYDYLGVSYDNALQYAADALPYVNSVFCMDTGTTGYVTISCGHWVFDVASSVVYTIAPLTTCTIEDRHNAQLRYYNGGDLKYALDINMLNITSLCANYLYLGNLVTDPVGPISGQLWYNSVEDTMKYYNGTAIVIVPGIGGGSSSSYILSPSYTIYASGSTYYMEKYDGTLASNTNASKLANFVIGNCSGGETIYIRDGYYPLNGSILSQGKNNIRLTGAGAGTVLALYGAVNNPVILPTSVSGWEVDHLTLDGNRSAQNAADYGTYGSDGINSYLCSNMKFHDLTIQNVNRTGISFAVNYNSSVTNCQFYNNNWNGFTDYGSNFTKCNFNTVTLSAEVGISVGGFYGQYQGNTIQNMTATTAGTHTGMNAHWGIGLEQYFSLCGNDIFDNQITNVSYGIWIDPLCFDNKIHDNTITAYDCFGEWHSGIVCYGYQNEIYDNAVNSTGSTAYGITISGTDGHGDYNSIRFNKIMAGDSGMVLTSDADNNRLIGNIFMRKGLTIGSGCNATLVTDNDFALCATPITDSGINSGTIIYNNLGFVTDNAGYQASCVNGTAIAHGLAGTPTSMTITMQGTNPYLNATAWYFVPTVLTVNATHFTISFCMNIGGTYTPVGTYDAKTIYWIAVYKP
jgi:hypothetical protein